VIRVRTDHPGASDIALLNLAEADGRVLLTLDKDFWQLTSRNGLGTPAWSPWIAS